MLDWHVERHAARTHITLLVDDEHALRLTCGELREGALRIAAALIERDLTPGRSYALMLPTSLDFFVVFLSFSASNFHSPTSRNPTVFNCSTGAPFNWRW